ncbi:MAG: hypothetical protein LBG96_15940 [Tannerella sp.]|nr:hypothetical protein [Tannerella sp.]
MNTFDGLPLMVITGELNEKLKVAIEKAIVEIKKITRKEANKDTRKALFTLVFDREAYEPKKKVKFYQPQSDLKEYSGTLEQYFLENPPRSTG